IPEYRFPHITVDELAVGTDPDSTIEVSRRMIMGLSALSKRGSSYVTTQFREVAERAVEDFNAHPLRVDRYHIEEGVGDARGSRLADTIGLTDAYIKDLVNKANK
ncbi:MAG: hypothetical protein KC506_03705, partial [Nanoarchaeota archaeon]|nr:hypothetical protein [Nanoarchaeota archaeon]